MNNTNSIKLLSLLLADYQLSDRYRSQVDRMDKIRALSSLAVEHCDRLKDARIQYRKARTAFHAISEERTKGLSTSDRGIINSFCQASDVLMERVAEFRLFMSQADRDLADHLYAWECEDMELRDQDWDHYGKVQTVSAEFNAIKQTLSEMSDPSDWQRLLQSARIS